jgi:hypothetical protein
MLRVVNVLADLLGGSKGLRALEVVGAVEGSVVIRHCVHERYGAHYAWYMGRMGKRIGFSTRSIPMIGQTIQVFRLPSEERGTQAITGNPGLLEMTRVLAECWTDDGGRFTLRGNRVYGRFEITCDMNGNYTLTRTS